MIVRKHISILILVLIPFVGMGQRGVGIYHLGDNIVQTNHMNAAFVPQAKTWIGLPTSLSIDLNSSHSFSEYFTKTEGTQNLDYDNILRNAGSSNATIINGRLNTLSIGHEISDKLGTAYFFTNERILGYISYPKDVITLIAKGNEPLVDKDIKLSDLRFSFSYFREIGLGYTVKAAKGLNFGVRLKYLRGLANASVDKDAEVIVRSLSNNFETTVEVSDAEVHLGGFSGSFSPFKASGTGYAIDLGLNYDVNRLLSLNVAINDFGFISWDSNVKNYGLSNSSVGFSGIEDLNDLSGEALDEIEDSLINSITNFRNNDAYKTSLHTNVILGARAQFGPRHEGYFTASNTFYFGSIHTLLGLGYGYQFKDWMRLGVNVVKPPQQIVDVGGSIVIDAGAAQLYLAVDKTLGYINLAKATGFDLSMGVNLLFGRPRAKKSDQYESSYSDNYWDLDPLVRPNKDVKVGHKHIYDIVQKGDPPSKWKLWLGKKKKKIKTIHARGRKPKSTRNGLK